MSSRLQIKLFLISLLVILLPTALGVTLDGFIRDLVEWTNWQNTTYALFAALLIGYYFLFLYVLKKAPSIMGSKVTTTRQEALTSKKIVIMGFSPEKKSGSVLEMTVTDILSRATRLGWDKYCSPTKAYKDNYLSAFKEQDEKNIPRDAWQQNLRALWPHRDTLEAVLILAPTDESVKESPTDGGVMISEISAISSIIQQMCKSTCKTQPVFVGVVPLHRSSAMPYFRSDKAGGGHSRPRDYEDYDYCYSGLKRGVDFCKKTGLNGKKYVESDIAIDITAGLKIFSIAGAIITLNSDVVFQYVSTITGDVIQYDTTVEFDPGPWSG
jgi:hypothetical protein